MSDKGTNDPDVCVIHRSLVCASVCVHMRACAHICVCTCVCTCLKDKEVCE